MKTLRDLIPLLDSIRACSNSRRWLSTFTPETTLDVVFDALSSEHTNWIDRLFISQKLESEGSPRYAAVHKVLFGPAYMQFVYNRSTKTAKDFSIIQYRYDTEDDFSDADYEYAINQLLEKIEELIADDWKAVTLPTPKGGGF